MTHPSPPQSSPPPSPPAWPASPAPAPAGVGRRLAAHVVDGVLVLLVFAALFVPAVLIDDAAFPEDPSGGAAVAFGVLLGLAFASYLLLWPLADVVLTHLRGGTPGKLLLGMRVVDLDTGGRLPWGRSFLRVLVKQGLGLVYLVGPIVDLAVMVSDARRQSVHDKAVRTVVVAVPRGAGSHRPVS